MSDLAEFLLARIAEDGAKARACDLARAGQPHSDGSGTTDRDAFPSYPWGAEEGELEFMAGPGHPSRVLAECEAKRQIVARVAEDAKIAGTPRAQSVTTTEWSLICQARDVLRLLALPYADHDDYRQEWKP